MSKKYIAIFVAILLIFFVWVFAGESIEDARKVCADKAVESVKKLTSGNMLSFQRAYDLVYENCLHTHGF